MLQLLWLQAEFIQINFILNNFHLQFRSIFKNLVILLFMLFIYPPVSVQRHFYQPADKRKCTRIKDGENRGGDGRREDENTRIFPA